MYAVSIDMDEQCRNDEPPKDVQPLSLQQQQQPLPIYPDLDLSKIELDCQLNSIGSTMTTESSQALPNIWRIVQAHQARSFDEITVSAGMLVHVIKQFTDCLYVRILGGGRNMAVSAQYGLIPKHCAIELNSYFANASSSQAVERTRRKSQITAL